MIRWLRLRLVQWIGRDVIASDLLKAAAYTGAVALLRDILKLAEDRQQQGYGLQCVINDIALNYYGGRAELDRLSSAIAKGNSMGLGQGERP